LAFSIAFLALFPSDRWAAAQDGYNGDAFTGQMAAQTPDWLYEGLKAPPRYLRAQEEVDRKWAALSGTSQTSGTVSQAIPSSPNWGIVSPAPAPASSWTVVRSPVPSTAPSAPAADRPDAWRYVLSGGYWWYYTPSQSWLIYRDNAWATYQATTQ
jgi:hypothetical protein